MDRWIGRVVVITGAASGIGAAISSSLVKHGVIVVGIDKNAVNLKKLAEQLENEKGQFYKLETNLINESEILSAFLWIEKNLGAIHGCINNAGILTKCKVLAETETKDVHEMFAVHVLAMHTCIKETVKSMKSHQVDEGIIINISSVVAFMSSPRPGFSAYSAAKKAVNGITEGLRIELALENSNIRTTIIGPGIVKTNLFEPVGSPILNRPHLEPENIAEIVLFCMQLPPTVQLTEVQVRPLGEDLTRP